MTVFQKLPTGMYTFNVQLLECTNGQSSIDGLCTNKKLEDANFETIRSIQVTEGDHTVLYCYKLHRPHERNF